MNNALYNMPFRGRSSDKQWRYGYYFAKPILEKYFILNGEEQWMVEKDTVCLKSGIPDKNCNELYEGDIVLYPWVNTPCFIKMLIAFENGEFVLKPIHTTCVDNHAYCSKYYSSECSASCGCIVWDIRLCGESNNIELIGNIFDNPELMKN